MEEPQELINTEKRIAEKQEITNLLRVASNTVVKFLVDQRTTAEEQQQTLKVELNNLRDKLTVATQTIENQSSLITQLSSDNLKLVAKLDALTGKKAPGKAFKA